MTRAPRGRLGRNALVSAALAVVVAAVVVPAAGALPTQSSRPLAVPVPHVASVAITGTACPSRAPAGTLWDGSAAIGAARLCQRAVSAAATLQARTAIRAAFSMLGAPYACGDVGRARTFRYDCSSLVARAYAAAGIRSSGPTWAASTRDMVPWDGRALAPWAAYVAPSRIRPGDLVLYDTGGATYRHVVMYLGSGYMLHTSYCGGVAHVAAFWGFGRSSHGRFLVARRVVVPGAAAPRPRDLSASAAARATTVSFARLLHHDAAATIRVQRALDQVVGVGLLVDGRWDGGMLAAIYGFRRGVMGESRSQAARPPDRDTLRRLGRLAGFALVA